MNLFLIVSVAIILINFCLLGIILLSSKRARSLAFTLIGIILWSSSISFIYLQQGDITNSFFSTFTPRLAFLGASLTVYGLFIFIHVYINRKNINRVKNLSFFGLLFFFHVLTPLVVKNVSGDEGRVVFNYGYGYVVFGLGIILAIIYSLYRIYKIRIFQADRREKKKTKPFFIGLSVSFAFIVFTNLLYPMIFGRSDLSGYGPLGLIFFSSLTVQSILKHNLFEIKLVLSEILLGGMGIIITIFLFLSGSWIELLLNLTTLVVFLVLASTLLREVLASLNRTNKLRRANKKLTETIEAKDNFLRMTSHQLRTPLTSLNGFLSMVVDKDNKEYSLDEKSYRDVIKVYINSQRLASVVNDILTVNAINAGRFGLNIRKDEDLEFIVQMILLERKSLIEYYNREVEYHKKGETFKADVEPTRFREIIQNLLDNAVIYAHEHILVELVDMPHDVRIIISDDGIGFTSYEKRKMTDRSYRGKEAVSRHPNGSGMGLFIVEKIVKAHQGNFKVHSEGRGRGTTVIVELPKKQNE